MKALVLQAAETLSLRDLAAPLPKNGEVVVDVQIAGIGGSEYLGYRAPGIRALPNVMGHGIAGTAGDGRRVAVNPLRGCGACDHCAQGLTQLCAGWSLIGVQSDGGFAQQVAVPRAALVDLPDDLSWEQTAFIEPFANAVNAWDLAAVQEGESVAVIGAGGLGLGLVACAAAQGAHAVAVSDLSPPRLAAAETLGAAETGAALGGGYDVVFDTVGSRATRLHAIDATRPAGRCVFLGFAEPETAINFAALIRQQKTLIGAFVYSPGQFRRAVELARRCDSGWVQNLSFEQVAPLLRAYLADDFSIVKAALRPNG